MIFSPEDYRRSIVVYNSTWRAADDARYQLCRLHPSHFEAAGLYAKILIIGRTYVTGIERNISSKGTQGSSMDQLGQYMLKKTHDLEEIFSELAKITEPLSVEKLRLIVILHGRFVRLLQPLTRNGKSTRAFCSKYMHFHCPLVPIIDTYVAAMLPGLVRWEKPLVLFEIPPVADTIYARYVLRFWKLFQDAVTKGLSPTVKYLDNYLLWMAENNT